MFWYGHGIGGWGYGLMALSQVAFWALVALAIVLLVRHFSRSRQQPGGPGVGPPGGGTPPGGFPAGSSAEQVLAERYARGEIDDEEYRRRLRTLREAAAPHGSTT